MKLGLGTVQFGMPYGISNQQGTTPPAEVARILELAAQGGISMLDTAPAYAASEEVLGEKLPGAHRFQIVTKTLKGDANTVATFQRSLERLKQSSVHGLLVHGAGELAGPQGDRIFKALVTLREQGLVKKIGTIVYDAAEIDSVLARFPIDLIQLPISLLDQRLLASGSLDRLKSAGVEIHARSVFLQGLLLMKPDALPPGFETVRPPLERINTDVARAGGSMVRAALQFVTQLKQIDRVIVGVTSASELAEILAALNATPLKLNWQEFPISDEKMLNPVNWPKPKTT